MLIVSGRIHLRKGSRPKFLKASLKEVALARKAAGCRDFVVAADPIEPDRVNVYEEWETEKQLLAFRGSGPDGGMMDLIESADVSMHVIKSSGPA